MEYEIKIIVFVEYYFTNWYLPSERREIYILTDIFHNYKM